VAGDAKPARDRLHQRRLPRAQFADEKNYAPRREAPPDRFTLLQELLSLKVSVVIPLREGITGNHNCQRKGAKTQRLIRLNG
jgi:hypothetical protein